MNNGRDSKSPSPILDLENKKSESELSDHPLVIDENHKEPADTEHGTNSDDETEERTFELDDLYREDSSIVDSDRDELSIAAPEDKSNSLPKAPETSFMSLPEKKPSPEKYISIEDALDLLDQPQEESSSLATEKDKSPVAAILSTPEVFQKDKERDLELSQDDEEEMTLPDLPEKLSSNEKPQRESENLPLHVFLSRKVQESKKRKQQQELKKLMEEQERIMLDLQPTRRQRKCAIGKQGLLAEISSSDEELSIPYSKKTTDKTENSEKARSKHRQRESKEKRKERYIEKKHEQMIAKEQKAIEEAIMRELEEKRQSAASEASGSEKDDIKPTEAPTEVKENTAASKHNNKSSPKKHSHKQNSHEAFDEIDDNVNKSKRPKSTTKLATDIDHDELNTSTEAAAPPKKKKAAARLTQKSRKAQKVEAKTPTEAKKAKQTPSSASRRSKSRPTSLNSSKDGKEPQPRPLSSKRESDLDGDEELKATRSWNKVDEGVGVAIGRRKRAAANQLYYWSSSSDDEDEAIFTVTESVPTVPAAPIVAQEGQEDDRQEQHGWIVGDSHKKMITMLAMEKQMKEKRRRSENDEQLPNGGGGGGGSGGGSTPTTGGKGKSKKHRNSTS